MKNVFMMFVLATATLSQSAVAYVYECSVRGQGEATYLIALEKDSGMSSGTGLLFRRENRHYKSLAGELSYVLTSDGGPTTVIFKAEQGDIDWTSAANRKQCFVMGEPTIEFSVSTRRRAASEAFYLPTIVHNPNWPADKMCPTPMLLMRPVAMDCRLL